MSTVLAKAEALEPVSFVSQGQQADLGMISRPGAAAAVLQPLRLRILGHLREPDSAAGVARALGLPRQRVHYHVQALEDEGLVRRVGQRKKGNCLENLLQTTARRYLIAPQALGDVAPDPDEVRDRFSSAYLLTSAARTLREVAELRDAAAQVGKRLPTLTLESEIRFRSPAEQQAFAEEMTEFFTRAAARYHDDGCEGGRSFRIALTGHPVPRRTDDDEETR